MDPMNDKGEPCRLIQPRCAAHATTAGAVKDRNPATKPILSANNRTTDPEFIRSPHNRAANYLGLVDDGSHTEKRVSPGLESTCIVPRCFRTMRCTVSRPSPVPSPTP